MQAVTIIFPNQLFKQNPAIQKGNLICLVEEELFFNQYNFHKQKLVLHRATMKHYQQFLLENDHVVEYINCTEKTSQISNLVAYLANKKITKIHYVDVDDNWLEKRIKAAAIAYALELQAYTSPAFLNTMQQGNNYFDGRKRYFQTEFYIAQRKLHNILLQPTGEPIGGQWSYDADNRKKYPAKQIAPKITYEKEDEIVEEAKQYVQKHFADNYGVSNEFIYPVTFASAELWLANFLQERFEQFGDYEDAIVANQPFLHHSVLSPVINIGLLTPQQVVHTALQYAAKHNTPLNSTEGFVRQIIGWREFIRIVYNRVGVQQRSKNYWGFERSIPANFWNGSTGIAPIDTVIKKVLQNGYLHHIERLMLLGNFMLLCEFKPNQVYKWYMEMFIDSYDWVMVPNVYGMILFADGGLITTKPYISGSNYVLKMSDYKASPCTLTPMQAYTWCQIWDGLFWRFMHIHRDFFTKNPRLGMLVKTFDKMSEEKRNNHVQIAEQYLQLLDTMK